MARLNKAAWDKPSLKRKEVEVEELGGSVLVRELPASYSAELNEHVQMKTVGREQIGSVDLVTMERLKFAYGVIGDNGEQLFNAEEAKEIATKHGRAFKAVLAAIDELSELVDPEEAQKSVDDRFRDGRASANGSDVEAGASAGGSGSDIPARTGSGAGDVG